MSSQAPVDGLPATCTSVMISTFPAGTVYGVAETTPERETCPEVMGVATEADIRRHATRLYEAAAASTPRLFDRKWWTGRLLEWAIRDGVPYADWVRDGYLVATPGDVTEYRAVRAGITALAERVQVHEIGSQVSDGPRRREHGLLVPAPEDHGHAGGPARVHHDAARVHPVGRQRAGHERPELVVADVDSDKCAASRRQDLVTPDGRRHGLGELLTGSRWVGRLLSHLE